VGRPTNGFCPCLQVLSSMGFPCSQGQLGWCRHTCLVVSSPCCYQPFPWLPRLRKEPMGRGPEVHSLTGQVQPTQAQLMTPGEQGLSGVPKGQASGNGSNAKQELGPNGSDSELHLNRHL
jgi:hypothetical protein